MNMLHRNDDTKQRFSNKADTFSIKSSISVLDLARADRLQLKKEGSNWTCCCPVHDEKTPSFTIYPNRGFYCFGCGAGGDVFTYLMLTRKISFLEAKAHLTGESFGKPAALRRPLPTQQPVEQPWIPVPAPIGAPPPLTVHYQLGKPVASWTYHNATGAVLAYVLRFLLRDEKGEPIIDPETGKPKKTDRPLTWGIGRHGILCWNWKGWPAPKPLYNLHLLTANPDWPVVVCEGEKSADAAATVFDDHICTTAMNGSQSPALANWEPLKDRDVFVWPDADEPGARYAATVADLVMAVGAASVTVWEFVL